MSLDSNFQQSPGHVGFAAYFKPSKPARTSAERTLGPASGKISDGERAHTSSVVRNAILHTLDRDDATRRAYLHARWQHGLR